MVKPDREPTIEVSQVEFTVAEVGEPTDEVGNLVARPILYSVEHLRRAWLFLRNALESEAPACVKTWCVALSVVSCQAAREVLEDGARRKDSFDEVEAILCRLPRKDLICLLRNLDQHVRPLPWVDGDYMLGSLVGMPGEGGISMQLLPQGPKRFRKGVTAKIKDGKAGYFWVRNGVAYAFDPSTGRQVRVANAITQYIKAFEKSIPDLAGAFGNVL